MERGNSGCNDVIVGPLDVEWLSHTHRLVSGAVLLFMDASIQLVVKSAVV